MASCGEIVFETLFLCGVLLATDLVAEPDFLTPDADEDFLAIVEAVLPELMSVPSQFLKQSINRRAPSSCIQKTSNAQPSFGYKTLAAAKALIKRTADF